jgi:hypothetical protein
MPVPGLLDLPPGIAHFYRYKDAGHLDSLKPVLLAHTIYVPTAKELNDPRECRPRFVSLSSRDVGRFLKESLYRRNPNWTLAERAEWSGYVDGMMQRKDSEEIQRYMADEMYARTERTRIFSMSARWDNLALWAKYADNHRGYCLEFSRAEWPFDMARPVNYGDSYEWDLRRPEDTAFAWTHYKSPEWSNEEEIRVVFHPTMESPNVVIGSNALTRILLGKDMKMSDHEQIIEWAHKRNPALTVMDVQYDDYRHRLILAPV